MPGHERRPTAWPDRRPAPPPPPRFHAAPCAACGESVAPDERDRGEPVRHLVCDLATRRGLSRRIEAGRSAHRAIAALSTVPVLRDRLASDIAALSDACDVAEVMAFLTRARTVVECSAELTPHQRRVALSFVESTVRKLSA